MIFIAFVVSYRNSTSNHNSLAHRAKDTGVVSYRNSTSNHNFSCINTSKTRVVSYRNSTSNHNHEGQSFFSDVLYLIEILHQTTTYRRFDLFFWGCILSKFYIKPQPSWWLRHNSCRCILSKFYIKPQHARGRVISCWVVSYRNSTSNHNQPCNGRAHAPVVSYRNSTSNHNFTSLTLINLKLYLIEILHQTTTARPPPPRSLCCILSKFYIKPQPHSSHLPHGTSCILSKFYIKPQPCESLTLGKVGCILSKFYIKPQQNRSSKNAFGVVSYRNSTSNHNRHCSINANAGVVSYRNSTSNHNSAFVIALAIPVVSYRNSTSNHNSGRTLWFW